MSVALLPFTIFAASQVGTPGPANMALMATGARYGLRAAVPFVLGVALGKQLIIWPIGFGLMELATTAPWLFIALKYASAAYVLWLAWRVAGLRLQVGEAGQVPGFAAGLIVHPLNPKAWAMVAAGFTNFTDPGTSALIATATIAGVLMGLQLMLHPLWTLAGAWVAARFAGTTVERGLFITLALLTVASVFYALTAGGFP